MAPAPAPKSSSSPPPPTRSGLPCWMQRQTGANSVSRALNVPRTEAIDRIASGHVFAPQQRRSLLDIVDDAIQMLDGSDQQQQPKKKKHEDQEAADKESKQ